MAASEVDLSSNKALQILNAAEEGKYGVPGVVSYNLETIVACVRAAERKRSPCQILLFPWAMHYANGLLVNLAADACRSASVPMSLHLDHAQDVESIHRACDMPFDSIMVDMSHHEKEENLRLTRELVEYCHRHGKTTEAEPGRINGGEDGVKDTGDLEGLLTTPEEALEFVDTGIDFLAPAFGNVHGFYGGEENIHLDYERLESVYRATHPESSSSGEEAELAGTGKTRRHVPLVLHGTNEFPAHIFEQCVKRGGITRVNVNDVILCNYNSYVRNEAGPGLALRGEEARTKAKESGIEPVALTEMMEKGTDLMVERLEWLMDVLGSSGKA